MKSNMEAGLSMPLQSVKSFICANALARFTCSESGGFCRKLIKNKSQVFQKQT